MKWITIPGVLILIILILGMGCDIQDQPNEVIPQETNRESNILPKESPSSQKNNKTFPQEYIDNSEDYLISKFGKDLFDSSINFLGVDTGNFVDGRDCNRITPKKVSGEKYFVYYSFSMDKYVKHNKEVGGGIYFDKIRVGYNHIGELYCVSGVLDCVNHPENCPPYSINNVEDAIEIFDKKCEGTFTRVYFQLEDKQYFSEGEKIDFGYINPSETKFYWYFDNTVCGERGCSIPWIVKIDPKDGNIVEDKNNICG